MAKPSIRIGTFGYRTVGKSTYLTTLYLFLLNRVYKNVSFSFGDNNSSKLLSNNLDEVIDNYSKTKDFAMMATKQNATELSFKINRKNISQDLMLVDHDGEQTVLSNMAVDDHELFEKLAGTDGIMVFYSNHDAESSESKRAYEIKRQRDLTFFLTRLKERLGGKKIEKPFVLVLTKSDSFDLSTATEDNSNLIELLQEYTTDSRVIGLSSKAAFKAFFENDIKLTDSERKNEPLIFAGNDIAYPLFWLIDTINKQYDDEQKRIAYKQIEIEEELVANTKPFWKRILPLLISGAVLWMVYKFAFGGFTSKTAETTADSTAAVVVDTTFLVPVSNNETYVDTTVAAIDTTAIASTKSQTQSSNEIENFDSPKSGVILSDNVLIRQNPDCLSDISASAKIDESISILAKQEVNCQDCRIINENVTANLVENGTIKSKTFQLGKNKCIKILSSDSEYSYCEFMDRFEYTSRLRQVRIPTSFLSDNSSQTWYRIRIESENIEGWIKAEFIKINE